MKNRKINSFLATLTYFILSLQLFAQPSISNKLVEKEMNVRRNNSITSKNYVKQDRVDSEKYNSQENQNIIKEITDTIFHFYKSGSISVIETPMRNNHKDIFLFDKKGIKTYEFEEERLVTGSISVSLRYAIDGSVSSAHIHQNPSASKYMYETDITFKEENHPSWKIEKQTSSENASLSIKSFWDGHKWSAQLEIKERDIPVLK